MIRPSYSTDLQSAVKGINARTQGIRPDPSVSAAVPIVRAPGQDPHHNDPSARPRPVNRAHNACNPAQHIQTVSISRNFLSAVMQLSAHIR